MNLKYSRTSDIREPLQGPEEEEAAFPPLESVRQMREICRVFKTLLLEVQGDARRQVGRHNAEDRSCKPEYDCQVHLIPFDDAT